jgi:hypothetical protein
LQDFLSLFLVVPEIGRGGLRLQPLQLRALGLYVKETSAVRPPVASSLRNFPAIPEWQSHRAFLYPSPVLNGH